MARTSIAVTAAVAMALSGCGGAEEPAPAQGAITTTVEQAQDKIDAAERAAAQMEKAAQSRADQVEESLER